MYDNSNSLQLSAGNSRQFSIEVRISEYQNFFQPTQQQALHGGQFLSLWSSSPEATL